MKTFGKSNMTIKEAAPVSVEGHENIVELGYLFLENTPLRILPVKEGGESAPTLPWWRPNVWYDLECLVVDANSSSETHDADYNGDVNLCKECELVVYPGSQSNGTLHLPWENAHKNNSSQQCTDRRKLKTDGAFLFGLLKSLESDVRVIQCRVLLLDDSCQHAAVYVTIGFPHMNNSPTHTKNGSNGGKSLLGSRTPKTLSDSMQLLLAIIQSDWDELRLREASLTNPDVTRSAIKRKTTTLFPPRLSMEELYRRIQSSPLDLKQSRMNLDWQLCKQSNDLTKLPRDILVRRLAPFLAAPDLDNIRCTCSYFHGLLKGVVPGLELALYQHQISSLNWMRDRERHELKESDCLKSCASEGMVCHGGDLHRAVSGGHTVRLVPRGADAGESFRVDTFTGCEYIGSVSNRTAGPQRRVCRGGLLVDEPGLGKTITVLSLILQTAGLSTESTRQSAIEQEDKTDDDALFNSYWRESVPADFRRHDLLRLVNTVAKRVRRGHFANTRRQVDLDAYAADFSVFEKDIEADISEFSNDPELSLSLTCTIRDAVVAYKAKMLNSAKKSCFSNPLAKPNSTLAALIEESKRWRFIKTLVPSRGTLVVIPSVLMDHWENQIESYINMRYLSHKLPLIYTFGNGSISVGAANQLIERGDHAPLVFFDRGGTTTLPPAEFLAKFLIVVTTNTRFSQEWKNGSFQKEVEKCQQGTAERLFERGLDRSTAEVCSLLKIHWLRMIVDEGHSMSRGSLGPTIQFASWISSERRWAMTGTPTKEGPMALSQLRNLLKFLQHDFFTPRCDGETTWKKYIAQPWKAGKSVEKGRTPAKSLPMGDLSSETGGLAAFFRLRSLLRLLMKRHTKEDIVELAPPVFKESRTQMSEVEVATYNALVTAIQSNLLLTAMKEDAQQDSLLHRSQVRYARQGLENVRSVCLGFSRMIPTLTEEYWNETVDLMQVYDVNPLSQIRVKDFMNRAQRGGLTGCDCCGLELSILLVMPCCGGLVCTECMDGQKSIQYTNDGSEKWMHKRGCKKKRANRKYYKKECLLCETYFDVDNLQLLQPGFYFFWQDNIETAKSKKGEGGEVPMSSADEHSRNAGASNGQQQQMDGAANGHQDNVIVRHPTARRKTKKAGDGHECEYDRYSIDGKCIHCLEEHSACNLLWSSRCPVCYRPARECPEEETKSSYLVKRCLSLMQGRPPTFQEREHGPRPIKIIVFSQFRKALNAVGDRLLGRFGTACVSEYWGRYRTTELHKFRVDPDCFCMLLGKDGSEGLDLSFVTHIFFLEEIWDKSLADQTVARAWRMGAKGAVQVETILAKDSVEEDMKAFEAGELTDQSAEEDASSSSFKQKDYMQRKTHVLLKSLRFIVDYHRLGNQPRIIANEGGSSTPKRKTSPSSSRPTKRLKVKFADDNS